MSTDRPWTHTYTHTYMYPRVLVSMDGTVTGDVHGPSMNWYMYSYIKHVILVANAIIIIENYEAVVKSHNEKTESKW